MADRIVIDDEPKQQAAPVAPMKRPSNGPSPFEVSLSSYTLHPWSARSADLSQWFNYGFTPASWSAYAYQQVRLFHESQKSSGPTG